MSQNLSSAAVVIGALRFKKKTCVNICVTKSALMLTINIHVHALNTNENIDILYRKQQTDLKCKRYNDDKNSKTDLTKQILQELTQTLNT